MENRNTPLTQANLISRWWELRNKCQALYPSGGFPSDELFSAHHWHESLANHMASFQNFLHSFTFLVVWMASYESQWVIDGDICSRISAYFVECFRPIWIVLFTVLAHQVLIIHQMNHKDFPVFLGVDGPPDNLTQSWSPKFHLVERMTSVSIEPKNENRT